MEERNRFTTEQVLRGIQAYVSEHVDTKLVLDPDASVGDYRKAVTCSHECPLWFLADLADYFGISSSDYRWAVWLRLPRDKGTARRRKELWNEWESTIIPAITVRQLAEYIAKRSTGCSFAPVTVFGVACAPAGAFKGLCQLPELEGIRVAPSSSIRGVLGAHKIEQLWGRVEWVCNQRLPRLHRTPWWSLSTTSNWIESIGLGMSVVGGILASIIVKESTDSIPLALWSAFVLFCALLMITCYTANQNRNPLPSNITTFGELARQIAKS